jgi:hypothetical protein
MTYVQTKLEFEKQDILAKPQVNYMAMPLN